MVWGLILCGVLLPLTLLRLFLAVSGKIDPSEALLLLCSSHPAGGYVEGPPGAPLLLAVNRFAFGCGCAALRWIPSAAGLIISWTVWWMGRRLAPARPAVAFWSALGVNLLPQFTLATLVMNGAMVKAACIMLLIVAGYRAVFEGAGKQRGSWMLFGAVLGIGTLFYYPAGIALALAVMLSLSLHGIHSLPWKAILSALLLLVLAWIPPLIWNGRHDWIQWSSVAAGFDSFRAGGRLISLGVTVAVGSILMPFLILLASRGALLWRILIFPPLAGCAVLSILILNFPDALPDGLPSTVGVEGIPDVARALLALREERPDQRGEKPFLIASTPGLASLLSGSVPVEYPELPGAPSVFVTESPSLNSSFALWPGYADAVVTAVKDPLYTEEKSASPFLGRNALYVTMEPPDGLPQTITGAFHAVGLLREMPMDWKGKRTNLRIYQCEDYSALAL